MGTQLMAIVAEGHTQANISSPQRENMNDRSRCERPIDVPDTELPEQALGFRVPGLRHDAPCRSFTNRQLTALCTFSDLVREAREQLLRDGGDAALRGCRRYLPSLGSRAKRADYSYTRVTVVCQQ